MSQKSNEIEGFKEASEAFLADLQKKFPKLTSQSPKIISKAILRASDQYVFHENTSFWEESWFQTAYMNYFIHTQYARLYHVFLKCKRHLTDFKIDSVLDFGCGPGTAQTAFQDCFSESLDWKNYDSQRQALVFAKTLLKNNSKTQFHLSQSLPSSASSDELLLLSFSLCEGFSTSALETYNHILILEPGQIKNSKSLIQLRNDFLEKGYYAHAPCPNQMLCPLTHEKKHWCHDSALKPEFLNHYDLPFSKKRLNLSYLLLSKTPPLESENLSRAIGDQRPEKGKTQIAICHKGFYKNLSWLKKSKLKMNLCRGDLIKVDEDYEVKGKEIRITKAPEKII